MATKFWSQALGLELGGRWPGHPEFRSWEQPGTESYVHLQVGDHGPRVHIDLEVDHIGAAAARCQDLGAELRHPGDGWQTMSSPGGLPFCLVSRATHETPPPATRGADGHRTRLVQICIDSPDAVHEAEVAFWRRVTGWRWVPSDRDEFAGKLFAPIGSSITRLLLQRLGRDDGGDQARAHIDLGTDDVDAEAARLVQLGAEVAWPGDRWVAMTDPVGMLFCVTPNPPD